MGSTRPCMVCDQRGLSCMKCRRFLYGLERFGRGDLRSIARISVQTKSNSQVASYAQRFFKRLNSAKKGKRLSINDIRSMNPEKLLAFEKATTSCMPGICCNEKSTDDSLKAPTGNQLQLGYSLRAPFEARIQLLQHGFPKKARSDASNQLLSPSPFLGTSDASPFPLGALQHR